MNRHTALHAAAIFTKLLITYRNATPDEATEATTSVSAIFRGVTESPILDSMTTQSQLVVANFVTTAATPDTRPGATPQQAWKRARSYEDLALINRLEILELGDIPRWRSSLTAANRHASIDITNIVGDQPRTSLPSGTPTPISDPDNKIQLDVMFNRTLHD